MLSWPPAFLAARPTVSKALEAADPATTETESSNRKVRASIRPSKAEINLPAPPQTRNIRSNLTLRPSARVMTFRKGERSASPWVMRPNLTCSSTSEWSSVSCSSRPCL